MSVPATLVGINTYPIKSCAVQRHTGIEVQPRGLDEDRRWLVTDPQGRFMTGREHGRLVRIVATATADGVRLEAAGMPPLAVLHPPSDAPVQPVEIWADRPPAALAGADQWLTEYLGTPAQLWYQRDEDVRPVPVEKGAEAGDHVSFADGYPVLLIGTASLEDLNGRLNGRLNAPVSMDQFRPNLIVKTEQAFVEDRWRRIRIGDCEFDLATRCSRCIFTTVDPATGQRDSGGEPFKTLRTYRFDKAKRGVMFGMNLIPRVIGQLGVGNDVQVLT